MGIVDWPIPHLGFSQPVLWLGNDPVLGRMICPPLTRLDLEREASEPLIFKSVDEVKKEQQHVWNLTLRSGIFWWNGEEVTPVQILEFLKKELPNIINEKGSGLWTERPVHLSRDGESIQVVWGKAPPFGPFVLNGVPLWRVRGTERQGQFGFECVGRYVPVITERGIGLNPNEKYGIPRASFLFQNSEQAQTHKVKEALRFSMADVLSARPEERNPHNEGQCSALIKLPMASVVIWNLKKPMLQNPHVRNEIADSFPRDTLLLSGAGNWGTTSSSLIPEGHPGYSAVRRKKRPAGSWKPDQALKFSSVRGEMGLVEKVLLDGLKARGIAASLIPMNDGGYDGLMTGVFFPWPEMDLFDRFHSQGLSIIGGNDAAPQQGQLDSLLRDYRTSLTRTHPDFALLRKISHLLGERELVTVLIHHKACLELPGMIKRNADIREKDPDWFLALLAQLRSTI
ncbi:MAG: hypothetical protein HYW48_11160 [Deltaproteobacteria bacterium]|nr:hypothetical protein [Deltaproteobacteria bacterium]